MIFTLRTCSVWYVWKLPFVTRVNLVSGFLWFVTNALKTDPALDKAREG